MTTLLAATAATASVAHADRAVLNVNVAQSGVRISPSLYGLFFEEINHAGDGGLYAELVRNRSLEDANTPVAWSLIEPEGTAAEMTLDSSQPQNTASPRSLRLEVGQTGGRRVGVANGGYWGIAVNKGHQYRLSLFARRNADFKGPLTVSVEDEAGKAYATGQIAKLTTSWQPFTITMTARDTAPKARLVIATTTPGTVWMDTISLFPVKTWKGRTNGLRYDLAEKMAVMKPAFIRFPGGCYVEGDRIANAFRWKNTIADIASRPGHLNDIWGYRSTDGLGYHEYLQMCEDIGADALFVVNCGMSHKDIIPMDQLGPWVQDALDAIEYATGPVTSKWGSIRAWNGHPKPFSLKYIQIGNENGGPAYNERYARFYDAIKARYPEIKLIANVWGGTPTSRPNEIIDEHYYSNPGFFIANANRYDRYDRKGPKIYVGEYAVTQGSGKGNLHAAIAEAAFMTGMERNADIVTMSSYAPLFVNVNDRRWNPDAICFDSATSYGTPSYHVQNLFSQHRGDVVLPTTATIETNNAQPNPAARGQIGLGTWLTQAEFKDVQVSHNGQTLYSSDFAGGAANWKTTQGNWSVQDGAYRQTSEGENIRAVAGDVNWTDYTLTLKARKIAGAEGFLIMFRVRDDQNWYWWNIGGWANQRHAIEKSQDGSKSIIGNEVNGRVETGRWYDIKIELAGSRIRCYLDGKLIHDVEDVAPKSLHFVASRSNQGGDIILKVANVSAQPHDTQINLAGVRQVKPTATAIVLTSEKLEDENSLEQPNKVAPVVTTVRVAPSFRHTFAPHSVTILRVKP